jgi:RHS repeat-associated protein
MSAATSAAGSVAYGYNALEQRVSKSGPGALVPSGAAYFVYGEAGQLLGEYDASGAPLYESVWLGGVPVGVIQQSGSAASATLAVNLYNVWADHLGAPRVITRQSDEAIVWRWDGAEPFGASAPDANPSALGAFTFNQRLPGQVFDAETGLLQNWHRDYNPRLGRYMQSDPIGLRGGINTYSYVEGNPLSYTDPSRPLKYLKVKSAAGRRPHR